MSKNDRSWIPDAVDLDWIESLAAACPPALAAIEAAAEPDRHPDRRPRQRAGPPGPRRRPAPDRRGRDGLRLLDALDGARPAGRRHDRDHRPRPRADRPRPRLVAPGRDRRRADHGRQRAGARGLRGRDPALAGPFDLAFIDALKPEYEAYLEALVRGSRPARPRRRRQRPVERPGVGRRPAAADDANTAALRAFDAAVLGDPRFTATILPVGDGLLIADLARLSRQTATRTVHRGSVSASSRSSASWPDARGPARPRRRSRRRGRLGGARRALPGPRARPAVAAVRPQRRLRRAGDAAGRRRRGGHDPAGLGRAEVAGGRGPDPRAPRDAVHDRDPGRAGRRASPIPEDGAVVGFVGRTRVDARDAGAGPGGRGRPPRRPAVDRSSTRRTRPRRRVKGHRLVRLVLERFRPPGRRGVPPRPAGPVPACRASIGSDPGTRPPPRPRGLRGRSASSARISVLNGVSRISTIRTARPRPAIGPCPARDRRDHGHLVAVGQDRPRLGVVAVASELHRGAAGREGWEERDERLPAVARRPPRRRGPADLAGPGQLPLDREQAHPDLHGVPRPSTHPRQVAMSSPSPSGRIVAVKRGSASTAASNARRAAVFASSAAAGRAPDTRPLHRTLSAATSAPGASRSARAPRGTPGTRA